MRTVPYTTHNPYPTCSTRYTHSHYSLCCTCYTHSPLHYTQSLPYMYTCYTHITYTTRSPWHYTQCCPLTAFHTSTCHQHAQLHPASHVTTTLAPQHAARMLRAHYARFATVGIVLTDSSLLHWPDQMFKKNYSLTKKFMSWQHLRSYQDRYRLVTVHTDGDFIVLPHWESRLLAPWSNFALCHIILILR